MIGAANHLVTILRGTEVDEYDDVVDSEVTAYTQVPISITERDRRVWLPAENQTRIVRSYEGAVGWETDLRKDDRIRLADGTIFHVVEISDPIEVFGVKPDRQVVLSRTT